MISLRPLAGAILTSVLLTGFAASPAAAATRETAAVSSAASSAVSSAASSAGALARPRNGAILFDRLTGGEGTLKIKNGTKKDAVVTLVRGKTKAISVYVRAKSKVSVNDITDGTYRIFFTTGYRYSTSKRKFSRAASYRRFDDRLRFNTTTTTSTVWTLTLNTVKGGNASTSGVDPNDFPR